tara:strand:- start:659 stop:1033 length:375 start_codon:yes stop_codon:yes gene_type:complete
MSDSDATIEIDKMSIDQAAGAFVMIAGAIGSLLLVIWQSKCHCRMNLCYIFQCERRPPSEDEMKSLKEQSKKLSKKQDKTLKKEDEILTKEEEILQKTRSPRAVRSQAMAMEPEPEPEMESIIP